VAAPDAHLDYRRRRRLATAGLLLGLAAAGLLMTSLAERFDPRRRAEKPERVLYLPRGDTLRYMTAGYNGVAADLVWIRSAMYVGRKVIRRDRRYEWMEKLYLVTTDLDPHWTRPYHAGAILLSALSQDDERALRLLGRGMARNGWSVHIPFQAAQLHLLRGRHEEALRYLNLMDRAYPDRPVFIPALISRIKTEGGQFQPAVQAAARGLYNTDDAVYREVTARAYREALARLLAYELSGAAAAYRRRFGRAPRDLAELKGLASVRRQFVARLAPPVSPTNVPDSETAEKLFKLLPTGPFGMEFYVRPAAAGVHSRGLERLELHRLLATLNHHLKLFKEDRGGPATDPREFVFYIRELAAAGRLRGGARKVFPGDPPVLPPHPMGPGTWFGDSPASWRNMLNVETGQLALPPGPEIQRMFRFAIPMPPGPKQRARQAALPGGRGR